MIAPAQVQVPATFTKAQLTSIVSEHVVAISLHSSSFVRTPQNHRGIAAVAVWHGGSLGYQRRRPKKESYMTDLDRIRR